jgi:hypothetical protein
VDPNLLDNFAEEFWMKRGANEAPTTIKVLHLENVTGGTRCSNMILDLLKGESPVFVE